MKGKRVVITGGAGFIGSNLAEHLCRDNEVSIIDDLSTGRLQNIQHLMKTPNLKFTRGSITHLPLLQSVFAGADYVFHQAALASVPMSIQEPIRTDEVNIRGTLNVLIAARDNGIKKVICASSCAIYGNTTTLPITESTSPDPQSPYAVTKLATEHYCRVFSSVYGLPAVCLRYFNVYGPRQDPRSDYAAVIPRFITQALHGWPLIIFGTGSQTRDFVFVRDVVAANIAAADAAAPGEYNIGSGVETSILKLAQTVTAATKKNSEIVYEPARPGEVLHSRADVSRAEEAFGFKPRFSLEAGLTETVKFFLNE